MPAVTVFKIILLTFGCLTLAILCDKLCSNLAANNPGIMWSITYCAVRKPGTPTAAA